MKRTITVSSKDDLKGTITYLNPSGRVDYNWFKGTIRNGNHYCEVNYYYNGNTLHILVSYRLDGSDVPAGFVTDTTSWRTVFKKVASFLELN